LSTLLAPAVAAARNGYSVARSQAQLTQEFFNELAPAPGFSETFLADGKAPGVGTELKQVALAETLVHLARKGLDDFYRGDVGDAIAADLEKIGSPVTREDLKQYAATLATPLRVETEAGTVFNTGAPTQGVASLMILALFARLKVAEAEGFDHVHGLVEATKRALFLSSTSVTDPEHLVNPLERYLQPNFLTSEASAIDRTKAATWPLPAGDKGDTVWMGAADASGIVVSYLQSIFWEFGSGCVLPATGILMQNRGVSFSLKKNSLNYLSPGRLPFHTLSPALAVLKDGRVMAYGAMGGFGQPQTQSAIFTRYALFNIPLAEAIARPRWLLRRQWSKSKPAVRIESRFDRNLVDRLRSAGHDIEVLEEAYSDIMGHAGAVVLHPNQNCEGAHDPRADGGSAGV
jgi:oxamate amidohydrolase